MVLQEVEVSQITNVLSYLIFSSVVQVDVVWSRSAFQVPFKSIKKLTLFLRLQYAVADGLRRSLNISNPLEMLV